MKRIFKVAGILVGCIVLLVFLTGLYINFFLPNVGKAPALTVERTSQRIQRGEYLANHVALCMDCHSTRRWDLYAGPMDSTGKAAGGERFGTEMGFPGTFYSPNITPHHLGNWSDGEIYRAITAGVNKEGKALFPLMAYKRFGKMADEDVYSIIAYIRTLPAIKKDNPASEPKFPVSLLLNTMPEKGTPGTIPSPNDKVAYGGYLVNAAGCVECHCQADDKGDLIAGTEFGGGRAFQSPVGIVRSANITMDKETGIGSWTEAAFVNRFRQYADSNYHPAKMGKDELNTVMPWSMYGGMKPEDLSAIYAYLKTVKPIRNQMVCYELAKK
jgi:hypothetical protein